MPINAPEPSYGEGYAPFNGPPENPSLWQGIVVNLDATLGNTDLIAKDVSEHNNQGILSSDLWTDSQSKYGLVWNFDGPTSGDYINLEAVLNAHTYDDFTIACWFKSNLTTQTDDGIIFWHGQTPGYNQYIDVEINDDTSAKRIQFVYRDPGAVTTVAGTTDMLDQQWHHIVAQRISGRAKVFIDGIEEGDVADGGQGTLSHAGVGYGPFIGDRPPDTEMLDGQIPSLALWDRGLAVAEIEILYRDHHAITRLAEETLVVTTGAAPPAGNRRRRMFFFGASA